MIKFSGKCILKKTNVILNIDLLWSWGHFIYTIILVIFLLII